jgi:hypothetical protein
MKTNANKRTPGTHSQKDKKDYDSAWKDVIEERFKDFLVFFFPQIHEDIDFTKDIEFLNMESRPVVPYSNVGKRLADVLVKVHLKDGTEKCICIFIHIEVQGQPETNFMERMYIYNYRAYDKYIDLGVEVISVAVLADEDVSYRPDEYLVSRWGYEHKMKIPIIKIIDYKIDPDKKNQLDNSTNLMAMIVRAQLKSHEAKKRDDQNKYAIKRELYKECFEAGYNRDEARTVFKFMDWVITIPEELQNKLKLEIMQLEEDYKMPYIPTYEREARKEGMEEGLAKGRQIGVKEGKQIGVKEEKLKTARELVKNGVDITIIAKATGLSIKEIEKLASSVH